jgi:hypothetical protein
VFEDLEKMGLLGPRTGPSLAVSTDRAAERPPDRAAPARAGERVAAWPGTAPAVAPLPAKDGPR